MPFCGDEIITDNEDVLSFGNCNHTVTVLDRMRDFTFRDYYAFNKESSADTSTREKVKFVFYDQEETAIEEFIVVLGTLNFEDSKKKYKPELEKTLDRVKTVLEREKIKKLLTNM